MKNKKFQEAFSAVRASDDMRNTVMALPAQARTEASRRGWKTLARVAACAAVVALLIGAMAGLPLGFGEDEEYVTAPGLLTITAYADEISEEYDEVLLEEGVILPAKFEYRIDYNTAQVLPIVLSIPEDAYPGKNITFDVYAMDGIFAKALKYDPNSPVFDPNTSWLDRIVGSYYGQKFSVDNNTEMHWTPWGMNFDYVVEQLRLGIPFEKLDETKINCFYSNCPSYIDIIIRADRYIVGYAVIEIREENCILGPSASDFTIEVLKIASFPSVNGKLQKISDEYVDNQIKITKEERNL